MHPTLRVANLGRLPAPYKRVAQAAADGSFEDLRNLVKLAREQKSVSHRFIPAFATHLDLGSAADSELHEVVSPADAKPIFMAFLALSGLSAIEGIHGLARELWTGLWQWPLIILQHVYCLGTSVQCQPAEAYATILNAVAFFQDMSNPTHHENFLQGCGGTLTHLALLVINLLTHVVLQDDLSFVLGPHMLYHSVLSKLKTSFRDIVARVNREGSRTSPAWEPWARFAHTVTLRMGMLKDYESDEYEALRACDNAECCKISHKSHFRRCSTCQSACYCSVACQATDWQRGHRALCAGIRAHWLADPDVMSTRDRSFFRYILDRDYANLARHELLRHVKFLNEYPNKVFFTSFEDQGGRFKLSCIPCADKGLLTDLGPMWTDSVARTLASRGRMYLHVMTVAEGSTTRSHIIPLRRRSAGLWQGLLQLARTFPEGTAERDLKKFPHVAEQLDRLIVEFCVGATGDIHA
ncbi:hypothetical protein C8R43DRAFT_1235259 [Mycena crocata]|nr:hypothetical protein C8R43DRAFT_1235259 [Mycena crocata]